jgi:hypothetical protein
MVLIGKQNCENDIPVHIENLPEIQKELAESNEAKDYTRMKLATSRLLRIAKDLDDMANEMDDITNGK